LMTARTGAPPRAISSINRRRVETGADFRLLNRAKNVTRYWLAIRCSELEAQEARLKALRKQRAPTSQQIPVRRKIKFLIGSIGRMVSRLEDLSPEDPLIPNSRRVVNGVKNIRV
jgi:hypothetical protein